MLTSYEKEDSVSVVKVGVAYAMHACNKEDHCYLGYTLSPVSLITRIAMAHADSVHCVAKSLHVRAKSY